jgi:hypothetical protein
MELCLDTWKLDPSWILFSLIGMDHCDAEDLRAPIQLHYLLRITVPEHQPNSKLGPPSIALGETRLHRRETLTTCRVHRQTIDIRSLLTIDIAAPIYLLIENKGLNNGLARL